MGLQGCGAARLRGCKVWGCVTAGLRACRGVGLQGVPRALLPGEGCRAEACPGYCSPSQAEGYRQLWGGFFASSCSRRMPCNHPCTDHCAGPPGKLQLHVQEQGEQRAKSFSQPPPPHPTQQRFLCSLAMQCLPLQCCEPGRTELGCTGLCSVPTAALQPGGGGGGMTAHSPHSAPEGKTARAPEKCLQPYKLTPLFIIFLSAVA